MDSKLNPKTTKFKYKYYNTIGIEDWNDWRWQLKKRLQTVGDFSHFLDLTNDEKDCLKSNSTRLNVSVTPYYASLIDRNNSHDPIRETVIPVLDELQLDQDAEYLDPLAEDLNSPVPGIVHRYPDRVLFITTDFCPVYCRYCTRSRIVGGKANFEINLKQWQNGIDYIAHHCEIRDVLISGGDPLIYTDSQLQWLLTRIRRIPHVEIIRIGTKIPFVLPQRITYELVGMLKLHHPIYMSLHVVHPNEITRESSDACSLLANAGIPLGSQTVLLKDVNDDVPTMTALMHNLLTIRVKPYYLLQCDPVFGTGHFRTAIDTGVEIIRGLRGHTSGYAVPHYIVDLPEGGGKVSIDPDYLDHQSGNTYEFTNYQGRGGFKYVEPN